MLTMNEQRAERDLVVAALMAAIAARQSNTDPTKVHAEVRAALRRAERLLEDEEAKRAPAKSISDIVLETYWEEMRR